MTFVLCAYLCRPYSPGVPASLAKVTSHMSWTRSGIRRSGQAATRNPRDFRHERSTTAPTGDQPYWILPRVALRASAVISGVL